MIHRVVLNLVIIITALSMPFWVTVLLFCLLAYIVVANPIEIVVYAMMLDVVFMSNTTATSFPIYTALALVIYILAETIKPRLLTRSI